MRALQDRFFFKKKAVVQLLLSFFSHLPLIHTHSMEESIKLFENKGQGTIRLDLAYKPRIALVTLENPSRHNAMSGKMMVELHNVITQLEENTNLVAVIFIGSSGSSFCAGLGKINT